jgi:glycosyltransferase involved in cell wall biosynthesis
VKVVHFLHGRANPNGTNGGDRVIYNLAKATAELGGQVFVFGLSNKPPLAIGQVKVHNFSPPRDPFSLPADLKRRLRTVKPDFVHFHGVYTPRSARLARWLRRQGIPYAVSPHGGLMKEVLSRGHTRKVAYLAVFGRTFCREASLLHCISDAEAEAVSHFFRDVPAVIAPHGLERIDLSTLDAQALRREYPTTKGKRIFGFLGRLDPAHKGLDLLVDAWARARTSLNHVVLVLAGPDWKNRTLALRRKVSELGVHESILFVGPRIGPPKFDFLASCDAFIHPSRWEAGVPFSVLDALEIAKPCLVSDGSFFSNFFRQHLAGIQVQSTTDGIAVGLRYLAQASDAELQKMGTNGRNAVLQEFSWERTAQKVLEAYGRCGSLTRQQVDTSLKRTPLSSI